MRVIQLEIDEGIYRELRAAITLRAMSGNMVGLLDSFMLVLFEKLEANEPRWAPRKREGK